VHTSTEETTQASLMLSANNDKFVHIPNTFKSTPNSKTSNVQVSTLWTGIRFILDPSTYYKKTGDAYFEIVSGYPRNHYIHKRALFSPYSITKYGYESENLVSESYVRSKQTNKTTIGADGLTDGSFPIETIEVGNVNLVKNENVINQIT